MSTLTDQFSQIFDVLVFIGRFEPLHKGHEEIIKNALSYCSKLIILVGSANRSRSIQNPWTFQERSQMIRVAIPEAYDGNRLSIVPLNDYTYNDPAWTANVQRLVDERVPKNAKVGLVGFSKDASSYYLKMFPQWGAINIPSQFSTFNSTDIRKEYFKSLPHLPTACCSTPVIDILTKFLYTEEFKLMVQEAEYVKNYKRGWLQAPHPPVFVTVDNIVVQSGHILLVERGDHPGKGLLALPGGFINQNETLREAAIRELREETKIADWKGEIPPGVLQSFITKTETFDDPRRSVRGRTITHGFLYELPKKESLYKVVGSDDAVGAKWYPIGTVPPNMFMEDHYFIMCKMLGLTME